MTDDAILAAPWPDLLAVLASASPDEQAEVLRHRFRHDRAAFARVCFPTQVFASESAFHADVVARPALAYWERKGETRELDLAHRGAAKSTYVSRLDVAHAVANGLERFVALAACTDDLAGRFAKTLWGIFRYPAAYPTFHQLYGPFVVTGGMTDFTVQAPGHPSCRVGSFSVKTNIRGENHEGQRPTMIVYDDMEHAKLANSPAEREAAWNWIVSDAGESGDPTCCRHRFVGTPTHRDGPVMRGLNSPAWRTKTWRALQAWPTNMALWEQARALWADLSDMDRVETARAFYERHRAEMDAGASVLWPDRYPLFALMCRWWTDAKKFAAEYQMDPRDPAAAIFDVDTFRRCRWDGAGAVTTSRGRVIRREACDVAVWLDPIPPSETGKDSAAVAVVWRERSTGQRLVVWAEMRRMTPSEQRAAMWSMFERWGQRAVYGYEDNAFAALFDESFEREAQERRAEGRPWQLVVRGLASTENKVEVIASIQPDVVNGWIEFDVGLPQEVIEQFGDLPNGAHDDGPDAIVHADRLLTTGMLAEPVVHR